MSELLEKVKKAASETKDAYEKRYQEKCDEYLKEDTKIADLAFQSLMNQILEKNLYGSIEITIKQSFGRSSFLNLVRKKLEEEGFVFAKYSSRIFDCTHPEIPNLAIWCYDESDGYGGGPRANFIRFSLK